MRVEDFALQFVVFKKFVGSYVVEWVLLGDVFANLLKAYLDS